MVKTYPQAIDQVIDTNHNVTLILKFYINSYLYYTNQLLDLVSIIQKNIAIEGLRNKTT